MILPTRNDAHLPRGVHLTFPLRCIVSMRANTRDAAAQLCHCFTNRHIMRTRLLSTCCFLIVATHSQLRAAEKQPAVTISELVSKTLAANPEIRFYEAEIAAAKAGRITAGRFSNPELNLDVGQKRVSTGDARAEGLAYSAALASPSSGQGDLACARRSPIATSRSQSLDWNRFRAFLASQRKSSRLCARHAAGECGSSGGSG